MLLKRTRILWSTKEKNCTQTERTYTNTEAISKRDSVTIFMYAKGCFIARYLSPLIKARWNRDAMVRLGNARVRNFNKQYPMGWSDISSIITAMKGGWIAAPTRKSVDANNASKIFDLVALNRDLVFTAIITKAFRTTVTGKVMMLITIMKQKNAWDEAGCWSRFSNVSNRLVPQLAGVS